MTTPSNAAYRKRVLADRRAQIHRELGTKCSFLRERADGEKIRGEIENRYFGASQKAILVAYRDAQRRFRLYRQGVRGDSLTRQDELSASPS